MSDDPFAPYLSADDGPPLIARIAAALRATDAELADVLDISRPAVNLWRHGKGSERYTPAQAGILAARMRERIADLEECITDLEPWAGTP